MPCVTSVSIQEVLSGKAISAYARELRRVVLAIHMAPRVTTATKRLGTVRIVVAVEANRALAGICSWNSVVDRARLYLTVSATIVLARGLIASGILVANDLILSGIGG